MTRKPATAGMLSLLLALGSSAAWSDPSMGRGELIYRVAGCENCHTDRKHQGQPLAGGRELATPFGTFYTPNITPDAETGIGRWRESDFKRALREGKSPEGANYYPSFPYTSYTRLSDDDIHALWEYLHNQKPVRQANKPHELPWYLRFRWTLTIWKWLFFEPGAFQAQPAKSAQWNRGAYLVQGPGHCNECHTPRNWLGGFKWNLSLAGVAHGPDDTLVPNITPDTTYGLGRWSQGDVIEYLGTGMQPDGDAAGSLMAEIIDNGLRYLPQDDLKAIAVYLGEQPAIANPVSKKKASSRHNDDGY